MFLFELNRKVQSDRTISLHGAVYELDACLVGQTVTVRFNPSRRGQPIDVYFKRRKYKKAKTVDTYANCFVRRDHTTKHLYPDTPPKPPPPGLSLRHLKNRKDR